MSAPTIEEAPVLPPTSGRRTRAPREAYKVNWGLTGLIRVFPRRRGRVDEAPFALPEGATIAELADRVHHELAAACTGGRVWGPSARFGGQRVGRYHVVVDGDVVEVMTR